MAPRGGFRENAGRPKGAKSKATLEREAETRTAMERLAILEAAVAGDAPKDVAAAASQAQKPMKQIAFELAHLFTGMTAYYQPVFKNGVQVNPNFNEAKFFECARLAKDTVLGAAPFQSPRYSAMVIGATVITKVAVEGGMPDDFAAPQTIDGEIAPGTVIEAVEAPELLAPPPKVAAG